MSLLSIILTTLTTLGGLLALASLGVLLVRWLRQIDPTDGMAKAAKTVQERLDLEMAEEMKALSKYPAFTVLQHPSGADAYVYVTESGQASRVYRDRSVCELYASEARREASFKALSASPKGSWVLLMTPEEAAKRRGLLQRAEQMRNSYQPN